MTACTRSRRSSLRSTQATWVWTVCSVMYRCAAISALDSPRDQAEHFAFPSGHEVQAGRGLPGLRLAAAGEQADQPVMAVFAIRSPLAAGWLCPAVRYG